VTDKEAEGRLAAARVARMATVDAAGRPHVVPVVFVLDGRRLYWAVDAKPKRSRDLQRLRNLVANPVVELVVDRYEEDWGALWWVRARGRARVVDDPDEGRAAISALAAKYPQYRDTPPPGPVVAVDVERVTSWAARAGT
jgi:PPOX class probable F420-dependent enzyme